MNREKLDLFNKKKIKKLEQENYELHSDIEGYIKNERIWSKQIDNLEKALTNTMQENQRLLDWVMNILKEFGTVEIGDRQHIEIPIHKQNICSVYDRNYMGVFEKERIEIPSITIVKMGYEENRYVKSK